MAGRAGRTYKRDGNGRFASTGGGGSKRPAAKRVAKGPNRLTRDNSGKITSVGGDGATVRGGRLRTAGGKLRARQTARVKAPGAKAGTIAKGGRGVSGAVARSLAAVRKSRVQAEKLNATKRVVPVKTSKKAPNAAQKRYKEATGWARSTRGWKELEDRKTANSAAAKVRLMERNRSTQIPKAGPDSPRERQRLRQAEQASRRQGRAWANQDKAWARESDGPNSKTSRSAAVAKRALEIYFGKVDPKVKTKARLTRTKDPEALRKRLAKMKDNAAIRKAKQAKRRG